MGLSCCKSEPLDPPPSGPPQSIFELASEVKRSQQVLALQEEELKVQKEKCQSVLVALHTQKKMLQEMVAQLAEARSEYDHWRHCFEALETQLQTGQRLSIRLSQMEQQCDTLRDKLQSLESDDSPSSHALLSQAKAEVSSIHSELRKSHGEMRRLGSGAQQQPEVFEFSEVVAQGRKTTGTRYSSYSRVSREPHLTAEETLSIEYEDALRGNILTHIAQLCDLDSLQLYDLVSTKLIVSALIKEKEVSDQEAAAKGLRPQSFPDFLVSIMVKSSKQSEGIQHVAMLMKSVKSYYDRSLQPGILFAKLFHLYHSQPVGYQFAAVVPRLFSRFGVVAEKRVEETEGRQEGFQVEFDDRAWLADVLDLVYSEFSGDSDSGGHLLLLLKPGEVRAEVYSHFLLLHKYTNSGFSLHDLVPAQRTAISQLSASLRKGLGVWLGEGDIQRYLTLLDQDGDGELSRADLKPAFDQSFASLRKDEKFSVSGLDFIFALEEVARERELRMAQDLVRAFGPRDSVLSIDEIWTGLKRVNPAIELETAQAVYHEIRRTKTEIWALDVVRVFLRLPLPPWDRSPLARPQLLGLREAPKAAALLVDSGNILEEQNEDD